MEHLQVFNYMLENIECFWMQWHVYNLKKNDFNMKQYVRFVDIYVRA